MGKDLSYIGPAVPEPMAKIKLMILLIVYVGLFDLDNPENGFWQMKKCFKAQLKVS